MNKCVLHGAAFALLLTVRAALGAEVKAPAAAAGELFPAAERTRLSERAADLKQQAALIEDRARRTRDAEQTECWKRVLVSSCLEEAEERYRKSTAEARRMDQDAGDIEREIRTRAAEARRAEKRDAAAARREKGIEMSVRTREQEAERERAAAARADKDATMSERAAAEAEARAEKEAAQEAKRAREDARAAQRAADQQERAAKVDERIRKREEARAKRDADAAARAAAKEAESRRGAE
ncbi:hypothetical protein [Methyloversatilis thermotolerans]|uniref:hypothetical protein n=1 Tax=Methyloversatilis thermotolerans TaxID=1346290 RepID=UPI001E42D8ED|nr:hypothetical protein [Methyloversatilis thermotolerans]